jgi:REP element-mobilizing transposase RayT
MPREARIDYPGALHHVIGRGIERRDIFKEKTLKSILSRSNMQCYAWCVMDNHFHLLLLTGTTPLSEFMRRLLTGYAVNYNKVHKRSGHSRNLEHDGSRRR